MFVFSFNKMVSQTHSARPRVVISRSPGTAESRTRGAVCPTLPSSPNPTDSVSVQDTMARTKRTARRDEGDGSIRVPRNEVYYDRPGTPSTPDDSILDLPPGQHEAESDQDSSQSFSLSSLNSSSDGSESEQGPSEKPDEEAASPERGQGEASSSLQNDYTPYFTHISLSTQKTRLKGLDEFRDTYVMGAGYEVKVPALTDAVVWPLNQSYQDTAFGCYAAVIQAGLRFPLDPAIEGILDGYRLGIWQLTPNSWVNILGYVAACRMQNVEPGFEAFASMHYLSKASQSAGPG